MSNLDKEKAQEVIELFYVKNGVLYRNKSNNTKLFCSSLSLARWNNKADNAIEIEFIRIGRSIYGRDFIFDIVVHGFEEGMRIREQKRRKNIALSINAKKLRANTRRTRAKIQEEGFPNIKTEPFDFNAELYPQNFIQCSASDVFNSMSVYG